jgi:hypothetical protein
LFLALRQAHPRQRWHAAQPIKSNKPITHFPCSQGVAPLCSLRFGNFRENDIMPTGDDLVAGEGRSANATTAVLASLEPGDPGNGYFGPTRPVFVAGPTDDLPNVPFAVFDGIHGSGSDPLRAGDAAFHGPGSGVVGFGGKSSGNFGPAQ